MVALLKNIQAEMVQEQTHFNALKSEQSGLGEKSSEQSKTLMSAMVDSQNRLTHLMDRTTICFAQVSMPYLQL